MQIFMHLSIEDVEIILQVCFSNQFLRTDILKTSCEIEFHRIPLMMNQSWLR